MCPPLRPGRLLSAYQLPYRAFFKCLVTLSFNWKIILMKIPLTLSLLVTTAPCLLFPPQAHLLKEKTQNVSLIIYTHSSARWNQARLPAQPDIAVARLTPWPPCCRIQWTPSSHRLVPNTACNHPLLKCSPELFIGIILTWFSSFSLPMPFCLFYWCLLLCLAIATDLLKKD